MIPKPDTSMWKVSEDCRSKTHNTLSSVTSSKRMPWCTCVHGQQLREEYLRGQRERAKVRNKSRSLAQVSGRKVSEVMKELEEFGAARSGEMMTMEGSLCSNPAGIKLADLAYDNMISAVGQARRAGMKRLCAQCPIRERCLAETQRLESPPGVWGGVWGGLDMWERAGQRVVFNLETKHWGLETTEALS